MGKKYTRLIVAVLAAHFVGSAIAEEHHGRHMHHNFPRDIDAFHSVLAPLWHSPAGKERSRNACAKGSEMEKLAKDIRSGDGTPLRAAVLALKKKCQGDPAGVDAALFEVHEAFHRLLDSGKTQ